MQNGQGKQHFPKGTEQKGNVAHLVPFVFKLQNLIFCTLSNSLSQNVLALDLKFAALSDVYA